MTAISSVKSPFSEGIALTPISISYPEDCEELLRAGHRKLSILPPLVLENVMEQAKTCEKLNVSGTNITWEELAVLSPIFKKLRYLDIRNCSNLHSEQYSSSLDHVLQSQGYRELEKIFPYHASLCVQVNNDLEIIFKHVPLKAGKYLPRDTKHRDIIIFLREHNGKISMHYSTDPRPHDFNVRELEPYFLSLDAADDQSFSEFLKIRAQRRASHCLIQ